MASTTTTSPATRKENLITLFGGLWLTMGLFIDGYAHANIIEETEDFFTPWHAIFYSGFTFVAMWVGWLLYKRQNARGIRSWIPDGYDWAVVGIVLFAIGGVSDLIWHTIFGVESDIDALLSPTHMLLLLGLILILAAPARSALRSDHPQPWITTFSVIMLTSLAAFFTTFARPISNGWLLALPYDPPALDEYDEFIALAVAGALLSTLILVVATIYLLQRLPSPPAGAITALWTVPAVLEAVGLSDYPVTVLVAAGVGGAVADVSYRQIGGSFRRRLMASIPVGVGVMWTLWTAINHVFNEPIRWAPEIWSGLIVMSMFAAFGVILTATPSPTPEAGGGGGDGGRGEIGVDTPVDTAAPDPTPAG